MMSKYDGTDSLCLALYGRVAEPKDYLDGSNAKMLYDAAAVVAAARCIRHWHDSGDDGMVASADHIHQLWDTLPSEVQRDTDKKTSGKSEPLITLEFDASGYPTDRTLEQIEKVDFIPNLDDIMDCLSPAFAVYGKCEREDSGLWTVCTGGWSGCESIVHAMQSNSYIWPVYWVLSKRGGYFELAPQDWNG